YFVAMAKSLDNVAGDGARTFMYNAVDVLTQNGSAMSAGSRTATENTYMVFLQFGVISAILRNYGAPDASGNQHAALSYPGTVSSNADGCALAAAFSHISDSFSGSDLNDDDTKAFVNNINAVCTGLGGSSCSSINKDRSVCDGLNAAS